MEILDWQTLTRDGRRAALARTGSVTQGEVSRLAREVIEAVRRSGDAALADYARRFDGSAPERLAVTSAELAAAHAALEPAQHGALERAFANVLRFHAAQIPQLLQLETQPGVQCEQLVRPIRAVGLYVPAGSAPLPSTVLMLAAPAVLAGCPSRILCTPPRRDGTAHPAVLAAAHLCGIERVFKVGGAQAIAALAYGTETVPKVDKIFGPGNAWVTAAKQLVAQDPEGAACDLPAGPSEVLVVADDSAWPEFIAADLLAQAEHDALAQAILVTDSRALAEAVAYEVRTQRVALSRREILSQSLAACRGIVVPDLDTALEVANAYAPEHLMLHLREPRRALPCVQNAGSVFLGAWSAEAFGDYCSGPNHVLPTAGHARAFSGLSVRDFMKMISVQELSPQGVQALGATAIALARLEGLDAHANAITRRLAALGAHAKPATRATAESAA